MNEVREYGYRSPRRPTAYTPPKRGLPGLIATRKPQDEAHRDDYNKIVFSLTKPKEGEEREWEIKIGNARIFAPRIGFSAKIYANAQTENPYDESEVPSLVGPPFYALGIHLSVTPARGNHVNVYVLRYFDAAGYLCWQKRLTLTSQTIIFSPMGDRKHIENQFFGEATPETDGYFFAMASGSISDCLGMGTDYEKKRNLWKLFKPYVLDLARRPEVLELEKPFAVTAHEELHGDPGDYFESLKKSVEESLPARNEGYYDETRENPAYYDLTWITGEDLPELKAELEQADLGTSIGITSEVLGATKVINVPGDPLKKPFEIIYTFSLTVGEACFIQYGRAWGGSTALASERYNLSAVPAELPDFTNEIASIPDRYKDRVYRALNAIYLKWIAVFRPTPEHAELHTDIGGGYEESRKSPF